MYIIIIINYMYYIIYFYKHFNFYKSPEHIKKYKKYKKFKCKIGNLFSDATVYVVLIKTIELTLTSF